MSALEIFGKHKDILIQEKLDSFKSLSQMNIDEIHNKVQIPKDDLQKIKDMAIIEYQSIQNLKSFKFDDY